MFEEEKRENKISLMEYNCINCNSKFLTNSNYDKCIFCNSTNIEKKDTFVNDKIKVIPFNKEYSDVVKDYNKRIKFNPIVPRSFRNKNIFSTLQKVYVPVLVTNVSRTGEVEFVGGEKNKSNETNKYTVIQSVRFNYNDVLFKMTSKIEDDTFNIINKYNLSNSIDINNNCFDDSFYLYEDISLNDISINGKEDIDKHSIKIMKNKVNHSLKKLIRDNTNILFENAKELLVPVFIMKVKYKDKDYTYIMNGENGNSYINIPISVTGIIILSLIVFVFVFLISYLVAYFL